MIKRRSMIKKSGLLFPGIYLSNAILALKSFFPEGNLKILIISGWQDVNIGDIAHTPGLLNVIQTFLPSAEITLWKKSSGKEVEAMLQKEFPRVKIVHGNVNTNADVEGDEVRSAFEYSDIMIHGSGPSVVGEINLKAWVKATGKPFGIFGTTIQTINPGLKELLNKALFIYTRETASLKMLEEYEIKAPSQFFVPDATFYLGLRNEDKALSFLKANSLEEKEYICAIPRLRKTPYYKIRPQSYTAKQITEIDDLNNSKKETDHAKLREAIITWVRETHKKVLVCPEMTYEVDIMDELLIDPLPEDVKPYVLKRGYWFPDEAASVYARAFAVLSFECHSPIIALRNMTPAFYLRQPEDTIKGQMYYDLGLSDWVFEIEDTMGQQISGKLMNLYRNPEKSITKLKKLHKEVYNYYSESIEILKSLK